MPHIKYTQQIHQKFALMQKEYDSDQIEAACRSAEALLQDIPHSHELYFYLGLIYNRLDQKEAAYQMQSTGLKIAPDVATYHFNAATFADANNDKLRAMQHYERCLHIEPNYVSALWNYSEHLRLDGHIEMAIECLHKLISLGQDHFDMFYNRLVACYALLEKYETKAKELYLRLLQNPDDNLARWGFALNELKHGQFDTGFTYYNYRFESSYLNNAYCHNYPYPLWDGTLKSGQHLIIHGEQGLGDEMMFMSTMNELLSEAKSAKAKIIICCKEPLVRLFALSFPDAIVLAHSYKKPALEVDQYPVSAQLPMGHLLERYRKNMSDFDDNRRPFFTAEAERVSYYNQRIKIQGRESIDGKRRFRVGLMWGTVSTETVHRFVRFANRKSIPLHMFAPFIDLIDQIEFVSLQNHERGAEAALVPELKIVDFSLDQNDFYDTAALMKNLDLILTIDTSIAHLAGGLGLETWIPLPKLADWRYGLTSDHSYWYEDTLLFRQTETDSWHDVILLIKNKLVERLKSSQ